MAKLPEITSLPDDQAQEVFRAEGVEMMFEEIKQSLHDFGVDFDVYFHENNLHKSGAVDRAIARLTELGNTYEQDGAIWLRTEQFGDDKDRVIIRSNGEPAYLSGDLAYYLDKRDRGFDRCFIMLGADHHGYVGRMNAMCAAFGDTPGKNLEILIGQMVNLLRDGSPMRMSKRAGTVVTIDDLVEAIGVDASRYALARFSSDSNIDLDLDLWAKQTNDNPVFYVQYAHARVSGILRNAADLAITAAAATDLLDGSTQVCCPTRRRASSCAPSRSSRAWWPAPPSCASRTGSPATSRTPPGSTTASTTSAGCSRWATRRSTTSTGPDSCWSPRPARCSPTGSTCSASPPPSGCDAVSHEAGWAHAPGALRGPAWLQAPADPNDLVTHLWSATARKVDGELHVGGLAIPDLVANVNTPAYVLDEADFRARARAFRDAFSAYDVFYAGKAFLCTAVAGWVQEEGLCLDVCSNSELTVALRAGFDPARIGYHGNNKSTIELRRAIVAGVGRIVVDSFDEIERLETITAEPGMTARVMVRVTAGVEAHTHEYIATAHEDQKFGFSITSRRCLRGRTAARGRRRASSCSVSTPTSAARSSTRPASRSRRVGCWPCTRGSPTSSASRCPRWTSAAASASPTRRRTTRRTRRSWRPRCPRSSSTSAVRSASPSPGCRSSPVGRSSARRCAPSTPSAPSSRCTWTAVRCAPTCRSTAG